VGPFFRGEAEEKREEKHQTVMAKKVLG